MKIIKHQLGGIVYTPYTPKSEQTQTSSRNHEKHDNSTDEIQKAIIKVVLEQNGLPNDVNYFLNQANKLLADRQNSIYGNESYVIEDLIKIQSLATRIKHNQTAFTNAVSRLDDEDSGAEVAITNTGALYVLDENNKLKTISISSYYDNSDKYQLLTQTELLNLRENSTDLIYNSSILNDLKSTIGLKTITEFIETAISKFGKYGFEESTISYTKKDQEKIAKGFENILNGAAPDGIYKIKTTTKQEHQGYNNQTQDGLFEAAQYLWNILNPQMKNTLRAHTVAEGLDPNNSLDVYKTLIMAIQMNTTHMFTREFDSNFDASASKTVSEGANSGGASKEIPETWGHAVQMNFGAEYINGTVLEGANIKFNFPAYHWGNIQDSDKKQVPSITTAEETIRNLQSHGIVDTRSIAYFGNLPLTQHAANLIYVDNKEGGSVVYLPVDRNHNIDFNMLDKMTKVQQYIVKNNIVEETAQKRIWEQQGFNYDSQYKTGVPKGYTLARYWAQVAGVSAGEDPYDESSLKDSKYINNVDISQIESYEDSYNSRLDIKKSKATRDTCYPVGDGYQSMIFIPLNYNENEALLAGGTGYVNRTNMAEIAANQQAAAWDYNTGMPHRVNGQNIDSLD